MITGKCQCKAKKARRAKKTCRGKSVRMGLHLDDRHMEGWECPVCEGGKLVYNRGARKGESLLYCKKCGWKSRPLT